MSPASEHPKTNTEQPAPLASATHAVARAGRMLLSCGADTSHVQRRMCELAQDLGHEAHVLVTPDAVLLTIGDDRQRDTRIGHEISAMKVDMGRLQAIETVLAEVHTGLLPAGAIDARLDAVEKGPGEHSALATVLAVAVTAASLARLFGADWPVVGAAFGAGAISMLLRLGLARHGFNALAVAFATAFVSGLCSALAVRLAPGASPVLCLTAAGMILVPGVPLINGVRDLVTGHSGNGVARLALGGATVLAIGFALFLAAACVGDALPVGDAPGSLPLGQDLLFAATAAAGFAVFFNVPSRAVWICVVCGMASHGLRNLLVHGGLDIASASLVGAFAAGLVARLAGAHYRVPPVAFAFAGIVALVPGSYAFRAGIGGLHVMALGAHTPTALLADTLSLAIAAAVMTTAIAVGLLLALSVRQGDGLAARRGNTPQRVGQ